MSSSATSKKPKQQQQQQQNRPATPGKRRRGRQSVAEPASITQKQAAPAAPGGRKRAADPLPTPGKRARMVPAATPTSTTKNPTAPAASSPSPSSIAAFQARLRSFAKINDKQRIRLARRLGNCRPSWNRRGIEHYEKHRIKAEAYKARLRKALQDHEALRRRAESASKSIGNLLDTTAVLGRTIATAINQQQLRTASATVLEIDRTMSNDFRYVTGSKRPFEETLKLKAARKIWQQRRRQLLNTGKVDGLPFDLQGAFDYLDKLVEDSRVLTEEAFFDQEYRLPVLRPGEAFNTHGALVAMRQSVQKPCVRWKQGSSADLEARLMRDEWDALFDPLSRGLFSVGPGEETVEASKVRKCAEDGSTKRGKKADKCWRAPNGLELAWHEAGRRSDACDPVKHDGDTIKVLKGRKDMCDRILEQTGSAVEFSAS
ncbi:hypothetical protein HDU88_008342 [Geranomyces variabilis]|nr:hypothetical protein HDU88_008342 [Geranomyces variabilis]